MNSGNLLEAWRQTDRLELPRREAARLKRSFTRTPSHLMWDGTPVEGRRVLIRCNHGLGDTVQFIRFCERLRQVAEHVIIMAQPSLVPLLQSTPEFGEISDGWTPESPPHDVVLEIMELAYLLRCGDADLTARAPYLNNPALRQRPVADLPRPHSDLLQVGLVWAASEWDSSRSLPPQIVGRLAQAPGIHWHSLQQGSAAALLPATGLPAQDAAPGTTAIEDAATFLLHLDLLITVDTLAAHLAGALGIPVWLLLKASPDWRWRSHGATTPWYPTMRLFRQPRDGDWQGVMDEVVNALTHHRPRKTSLSP